MQVDDSGCDDQSGRIQHLLGVASLEMADLCDPAILDTDVGLVRRQPCPIDNRPTFDQLIELCHGSLRVLTLRYSISSVLVPTSRPHLRLRFQAGFGRDVSRISKAAPKLQSIALAGSEMEDATPFATDAEGVWINTATRCGMSDSGRAYISPKRFTGFPGGIGAPE